MAKSLINWINQLISSSEHPRKGALSPQCGGVKLPLGEFLAATFDLEKAVCSRCLFMMAPNHCDSFFRTLQRPLRLDDEDDRNSSSSSSPLTVQISHPSKAPNSLLLCVFSTDFLSPQQTKSLLGQVRRMLRLTEEEEKNVREFQEMLCNKVVQTLPCVTSGSDFPVCSICRT